MLKRFSYVLLGLCGVGLIGLSVLPPVAQAADKAQPAGKPVPPPPAPAYTVFGIGAGITIRDMNEEGQMVYIVNQQQLGVITPDDANGLSAVTLPMPDQAWFEAALDLTLTPDLELQGLGFNLSYYRSPVIGKGIVATSIEGRVVRKSDGQVLSTFRRPAVVKLVDDDGNGINDEPFMDIQSGDMVFLDMNEFGAIVTLVEYEDGTAQLFRIMPLDTDDDGVGDVWFADDGNGNNDLVEDLGPPFAQSIDLSIDVTVDNAGRAYIWYADYPTQTETCEFVLPDGTHCPVGSSADGIRLYAANRTGLAVGRYKTGRTYPSTFGQLPVYAPCCIQGRDLLVDDNNPDTWYRDANNDSHNDLLVKLGTLSGYAYNVVVNAVNDRGEMVGSGGGKNGGRAQIWKNGVAVDLNTQVSLPGVILHEAVGITATGTILCNHHWIPVGSNTSRDDFYLLTPIPTP
jgi:hypothetical protein